MTISSRLAAGWLVAVAACGGSSSPQTSDADPNHDGGGDATNLAECDKPANVIRRDALLAAQPVIGVDTRSQLTTTVSFPSEADDPSVTCSVELAFKDSNGNGELDGYEDWRTGATVLDRKSVV